MEIIFNEFTFLNKEGASFEEIFSNWKKYKHEVPVYGAIMLDEILENCILVRGYHKRISWGFPKGKVNKDEKGKDCAAREVSEETGYDIKSLLDENEYLEWNFHDHRVRLYIVPFVKSSFTFEPRTRGEIQEIKWFPIDALPSHKKDATSRDRLGLNASSFFMVQPFVKNLRKWVNQKKQSIQNFGLFQPSHIRQSQFSAFTLVDSAKEEEDRLLKRKKEEEKRFQEIQLSSHPLLDASRSEEQLRSLIGLTPTRVKSKKKTEKEKSRERQPEAIRRLLAGTVGVSQAGKSEHQLLRGFGVPPEYLEKKKQPETNSYTDWDKETEIHSRGNNTYPHDDMETSWQLENRQVLEQGLKKQFDKRARSHVSENGLHSESRANRIISNGNAPSRGWYSSTTGGMSENSDHSVDCTTGSPEKFVAQPKRKYEDNYSKQIKGKKSLDSVDETFQFHIPEFLNFTFDTEALIRTLPRETVF